MVDKSTGLVWADTPSPGDLVGSNPVYPEYDASAWVQSLNTFVNPDGTIGYGGYTDWDLPSIYQMTHLFNELGPPISYPFIPFVNLNSGNFFYWSSTAGPTQGFVWIWAAFQPISAAPVMYPSWLPATGVSAPYGLGALAVRGTQSVTGPSCVPPVNNTGVFSVIEIPAAANGQYPTTPPIGLALNACGQVTGAINPYYNGGFQVQSDLFVYSSGALNGYLSGTTDLGSPAACSKDVNVGYGINAIGQITGLQCAEGAASTAFLYQSGSFFSIAQNAQASVINSKNAINSNGVVVGTVGAAVQPGCPGNGFDAVLYFPSTGISQPLGSDFQCSSQGVAINDAGTIAGGFYDSLSIEHGFLLSNGTVVDVGNIGCTNNPNFPSYATQVNGINSSGQATGFSELGCNKTADAFLYTQGNSANGVQCYPSTPISPSTSAEICDLGNLGGSYGSQGNAINAGGQIVGQSWTAGDAAPHAFLYSNGSMQDLNSLISSSDAAQYTLVNGVAINDAGQILAQGYISANQSQTVTFLLTPPSPSSVPPSITPTIVGTQGDNGWYTSNVSVTWIVTDPLAPIISQTGCGSTTISDDTTGQTITCSAVGQGGTATQSVTIKRDATAPVASATVLPLPNGNGWNNTAVSVSFSGTDSTSGIASCSSPATVSSQGARQTSPSGTCTDNAGNVSAPMSATNISIDMTPPVVSGAAAPSPNGNGWNNSAVTVTFTATDALSGVATTGCQTPVVLTANGSAQSVTGTCSDRAGNQGTATVTGINIEFTPPTVTDVITDSVPESLTGWYTAPVTIHFAGTDALSGVSPGACTAPITLNASGAGQSVAGSCTNLAGDVGTITVSGVNVDLTVPVASYTAIPPPNAAGWNNTPVTVTFSGSDSVNGSGIAACTAPVSLSTSGAGQLATGTCTSVAGTVSAAVTDMVNINLTPPIIAIGNPANNAGYPLGAAVNAIYTCTDASGVGAASCTGTVPSGTPLGTASPGTQTFAVTATDLAGNTTTTNTSYLVSSLTLSTPGSIWTFAGDGITGFFGDGQAATSAELHYPDNVAVDLIGNVYIADGVNQRIRKVSVDGTISTVAGNGISGFSGDGGPAVSAELSAPNAVAVDTAGNLYIADSGNSRIRKVGTDGNISTVAGTGNPGFNGDGEPATSAQLFDPYGVAVAADGSLFVADWGNRRIRKVATDGTISTLAGNGATGPYSGESGPATSATVSCPYGVAVDASGNVYIADNCAALVLKVATDGTISTVAGTATQGFSGDGGLATSAGLNDPVSVAVDSVGNVYIAEDNSRIRRVGTNGIISTVAGNGTAGFSGDGGLAFDAEINQPSGVAVDATGNLYIADAANNRIRFVPVPSPPDTSPPAITPTITGSLGANGWYTSNVTVTWAVSDPLAAIISQTGCGSTTIGTDTTGQTITCTAVGQGGTSSQSVTIKRDATAPVATATATPAPNVNGWNNSAVTVNFTGSDSTSGVASCSPPVTLAAEGLGQTSSAGTCTDNAGNVSAAVKASGINIDKTPPVVSGSKSPNPNAAGWNTTPVTVTFTATDALSGVAANGCGTPTVVSSNGAAQSVTGQCTDKAGNVGSATVAGISIDTIAPTAVATRTPGPNANGWNNTSVTVSFAGTDNLSGSGVASCSTSVNLSAEGSGESASGTCTDVAGNVSAPAVASPVDIDKTPPTATITTPASGAVYPLGATVNAVYACNDAGVAPSGVATCVGTTVNGAHINTSATGSKSYTVTATDEAGNVTQSTVSYSVSAATPAFVLLPNPLAFGSQTENVPSAALSVTLTSTGTTTLVISSITVTGAKANQFSQSNNCGTSVASGATCTIIVEFNPTSGGAKTANISVNGGAAGTKTVALTGTGVPPTISASPSAVPFGNEQTTVASAAQVVTVSNATAVAVPITSITFGGTNANQFTETSTCATSVAAASTCTISVVFTPKSTGAKSATLSVKPGGGAATVTVALTGTGIVPTYTVTPNPVAFGSQAVGLASASHTLTLTNTGTLGLPITSIALTGGNANQFALTNTCGASLAAAATCTVSVVFTPTSTGSKSSTIRVTAGEGAATVSVPVTGTGIVPTYTLTPTALAFGSQAHNSASAAQTITLTNSGTLALPITSITLTGSNANQFSESNSCGASVPSGNSCTISVVFKPTSTGAKSATLRVTPRAGASVQSTTLSGTGT